MLFCLRNSENYLPSCNIELQCLESLMTHLQIKKYILNRPFRNLQKGIEESPAHFDSLDNSKKFGYFRLFPPFISHMIVFSLAYLAIWSSFHPFLCVF